MPWATISCCSGSSHCSALCNYTVYNRTLSCSFFLRYFLLHFPPFLVFTECFLLLNACFVDRGPAGGEGCVRAAVFETLLFRSTLFVVRSVCFVPLATLLFYYSIMTCHFFIGSHDSHNLKANKKQRIRLQASKLFIYIIHEQLIRIFN